MANKSVTSTAAGLGTKGLFCPYDKNTVFFSSSNWTGQTLEIHSAPTDTTAEYSAERQGLDADTAFSTQADGRIVVEGPVWIRPSLASPAGGVTLTLMDPFVGIS